MTTTPDTVTAFDTRLPLVATSERSDAAKYAATRDGFTVRAMRIGARWTVTIGAEVDGRVRTLVKGSGASVVEADREAREALANRAR